MPKVASGLIVLIFVTSPLVAFADSHFPFRNLRQVDPTGRYYLVVKKNGGEGDPGRGTPITFEIAERKPGSLPIAEGDPKQLKAAIPDLMKLLESEPKTQKPLFTQRLSAMTMGFDRPRGQSRTPFADRPRREA